MAKGGKIHFDVRNWLSRTRKKSSTNGLSGLAWALYHVYLGGFMTVSSRISIGTNVFERDWDVLIVLDACRVDVMREVAPTIEFIENVQSIWSVGSTSSEWITNTFTQRYIDYISECVYVTSNVFADRVLVERQRPPISETHSIDFPVPLAYPDWDVADSADLKRLDKVWEYSDIEAGGGFPPRLVTDRAISLGRELDHDRMIVHYMQPHTPYIGKYVPPILRNTTRGDMNHIRELLRSNELSKQEIWKGYKSNLELVLDDVELLLDNLEADKVVITADHGEGFGERGSYGHTFGWPNPVVKKVPWIETTANDSGEYHPDPLDHDETDTDTDILNHLQNLGYR